jgi:branched-chain amino acid transport system ATP-binding protein
MAHSDILLETRGASLHFGGIAALDDLSISVRQGEIFGLIGPNGAGKTTLLNAISGVFPLTAGAIFFEDRDISTVPLHKRPGIGIGRTFQGIELFADLTVQDNLMVGRHHLMRSGILASGLFVGPAKREEIEHRRHVEQIIEFFELERYRKRRVGSLAYGIQKIVGVARALCSEPRILLLDEVASGLNREEKEDLARFLLRIRHTRGITMIWVEHDIRMISELADKIAVLDYGRLVQAGSTQAGQKGAARLPGNARSFPGQDLGLRAYCGHGHHREARRDPFDTAEPAAAAQCAEHEAA